jgi:sensor histidine kinase YesM
MGSLTNTNPVLVRGVAPSALTRTAPVRLPIRLNGVAVIWLASIALALVTAAECHSVFYLPSLRYGFVLWGWWGVVATIQWKLGQRAPSTMSVSAPVLAAHLLIGCALGAVHLVALGSLGFAEPNWRAHTTVYAILTGMLQINRYGLEILIYAFVFTIAGIAQLQLRSQRDAIHSLELERQLSAAHLRALQMQLEPHFLFNTLNAITTLVELGRQRDAAEMLAHLNAILKTTLARSTPEKVPLSQELEMVENYLAIEQVRFADRLRIAITVEPGALDGLVPCFLLQPIVENAIRHGIARREDSGTIEASARREGGLLRLEVYNSGSDAPSAPGNGIGLKNTRERLTHFYPDGFTMQAQSAPAGGYSVNITIPYESA